MMRERKTDFKVCYINWSHSRRCGCFYFVVSRNSVSPLFRFSLIQRLSSFYLLYFFRSGSQLTVFMHSKSAVASFMYVNCERLDNEKLLINLFQMAIYLIVAFDLLCKLKFQFTYFIFRYSLLFYFSL